MSSEEQLSGGGVDALISRLKAEGVSAGQAEARRIVEDAERRAQWLLKQAQDEAEQIRSQARADADKFQTAGQQALEVAIRDALLRLKAELAGLFHEELRRQVRQTLSVEETLKQIVLRLAGRVAEDLHGSGTVFDLPDRAKGLEELRHEPDELESGMLTNLTRAIASDLFGQEVTLLSATGGESSGIRLRLGAESIELEFSDETVSALLQMHLQPRFRALMEGIVQ
jgi:V/A-type H+-transporting ATPase subunit E